MTISLRTLDQDTREIDDQEVERLRSALAGTLALPGEPGYDEARTIWNATVDRRPGLAVRAAEAGDAQKAVAFARDHDLLLAIRSGGHQIAGHAVADGALLLDLSQMRAVEIDPQARTARVEAGATLADVDAATQAHGLAVPVGINSTTGIAGLTLGGGFGWTTRKYGLTIDCLRAVDLVTAGGEALRVSADEHPDLFWAIRGGGGNFGVVTAFEFDLHPVGPEVLAGLIVHPAEDAPDLLRAFGRIADAAPDELTIWAVMRQAPPLPFLPEAWHGREILVFAVCYVGDIAEGEAALAELRGLGQPIADVVGPTPFADWEQTFDPLLTPGARNYWKSHDLMQISDGLIGAVGEAVQSLPTPECEVFIAHVGGAMARVDEAATAFPQRASHFVMNVHTRWQDPADDAACIGWARELFDKVAPHAAGSVYVNFMPDDEADRVAGGAYGGNMERLAKVKAKYDPDNRFRLNHNIPPAPQPRAAE